MPVRIYWATIIWQVWVVAYTLVHLGSAHPLKTLSSTCTRRRLVNKVKSKKHASILEMGCVGGME